MYNFLSDTYHKIVLPLHSKAIAAKKAKLDLKTEMAKCISVLSDISGLDVGKFLDEYDNSDFRKKYLAKVEEMKNVNRFVETASDFDCRVIYLFIRALKPKVMVETGVLYGGFTAHTLEAMTQNSQGKLYSIDFPFDAADKKFHGCLVMDEHKERWELILGDTRKELPALLKKLGKIDFFQHDSSHLPSIMYFEYKTAMPFISNGYITSHNVIGSKFQENTFEKFARKNRLTYYIFRNMGLCLVK